MDVTNVVAGNIKKLRETKKLTLDAAAELTGVSRSMLAQIEKGDVNPTISVLWKIANGYKVHFSRLLDQKPDETCVIREEERVPLEEDEGRYLNQVVFGFDEKTPFDLCRILIEPEGRLEAQPHLNGAEELITVYAGQVEITVAEKTYLLNKGDSIRFLANVPHGYRNTGESRAELSMLICYDR